jgi:hypothetical protein
LKFGEWVESAVRKPEFESPAVIVPLSHSVQIAFPLRGFDTESTFYLFIG